MKQYQYCLFALYLGIYVKPSFADSEFAARLSAAAFDRTFSSVRYDGAYRSIAYPNGDVPADIGVCTDVVIRTYRALGIDLQKRLHEDIRENFDLYPSHRIWGLTRPDTNIDHRRVPNLQAFFKRNGQSFGRNSPVEDYLAGDLVTWMLPGNLPHIGIVSAKRDKNSGRPLIVHNIGSGPIAEDMLLDYPITGHYRYRPVD